MNKIMSNEPTEQKQDGINGKAARRLKLDAASIEIVAALYADIGIADDIIWLGNFTRERCSKNLDVLKSSVRKLGFTKASASYFYKILTGRYRDPATNRMLGSVDNFKEIVDALRKQFRVTATTGKTPFIETGTWFEIRNYCDVLRAPDRINKFGLIIKPTGSQGTACLKQYVLLNNSGLCVLVDSPETPSLGKFVTDLAMAYGGGLSWTHSKKYEHIKSSVNDKKTIFVDNIQRLYNQNKGGDQPIFHFLQKIQEETGCTIIMSCTPEFQHTLIADKKSAGFFEQFVGRIGGSDEFLVLPAYTPREDIIQIAEAFGVPTTKQIIELLEGISRRPGRVRVLFGILQKAKRAAANQPVSLAHLLIAANKEKIEIVEAKEAA